ncbi:hypothetical protein V2V21_31370 [Pseudomonas aeruginosa]
MAVKKRQGQTRWYTDAEVMEPSFRLEAGVTDEGVEYKDLFMQIFEQESSEPRRWRSLPEPDWHHLARVFLQKIITYPVFTNPHAQRYLASRHGPFRTVIYESSYGRDLPDSAASAAYYIELALPWRTSNPCTFGLGLTAELDEIWRGLSSFPNLNAIVVARAGTLQVDGNAVRIPEEELQRVRRAFERTKRKMREVVKQARSTHIRNVLLAQLDPTRFPPIVQVNPDGQLVEVRLDRGRQSQEAARSGRKATVKAVRSNVETLVAEAPEELIELHAEIERVTLAQMIEKYEDMLQKGLPETAWQKFFERNIFILTMIFARPVRLLHTQFHAQGGG